VSWPHSPRFPRGASVHGARDRRSAAGTRHTEAVLAVFGVVALTFMMLMYALERRGSRFVLAFACGCALSSLYGFLAGT
jgi:hypothetical protein